MLYIHECTERLTQEFTVKEITALSRLDDDNLIKVIYLKVKAFIPSDQNIESQIEDFETGDVVSLKGKFVACSQYYSVCDQFRFALFIRFSTSINWN